VKRADFIQYWRRSGLKNPDKPKIFTKNERNHSYHQFWRRSGLTEVYYTVLSGVSYMQNPGSL